MRTSTWRRACPPPTGWISPLSRARKRRAWISTGVSPISSSRSVPPSAWRKKPPRAASAPVKAPLAAPKSSAAARLGGIAAMLTATWGPWRRGLAWWMARATNSLPLPVSPRSRSGTGNTATRRISRRNATIGALEPSNPKSGSRGDGCGSRRCKRSTTRRASRSTTPRRKLAAGSSRRDFSSRPSADTAVGASPRSSTRPPAAPGERRNGRRLTWESARGRGSPPWGGAKLGPSRDRETGRPASSAGRRTCSPRRRGSGW